MDYSRALAARQLDYSRALAARQLNYTPALASTWAGCKQYLKRKKAELMKYKISKNFIAASGLTFALIVGGPLAQADSITQNITDVRQEVQIWTTYTLNPYLRANDLKASVKDGTATLTGTVPEGINKDLAREIALRDFQRAALASH